MHVVLESDKAKTFGCLISALLSDSIPEDSVLMVTCSESSGRYRATADVGGPEPSIVT
jgi:hypothetical protein